MVIALLLFVGLLPFLVLGVLTTYIVSNFLDIAPWEQDNFTHANSVTDFVSGGPTATGCD